MKYLGLLALIALTACATVAERTDNNSGVGFDIYGVPAKTN